MLPVMKCDLCCSYIWPLRWWQFTHSQRSYWWHHSKDWWTDTRILEWTLSICEFIL